VARGHPSDTAEPAQEPVNKSKQSAAKQDMATKKQTILSTFLTRPNVRLSMIRKSEQGSSWNDVVPACSRADQQVDGTCCGRLILVARVRGRVLSLERSACQSADTA